MAASHRRAPWQVAGQEGWLEGREAEMVERSHSCCGSRAPLTGWMYQEPHLGRWKTWLVAVEATALHLPVGSLTLAKA